MCYSNGKPFKELSRRETFIKPCNKKRMIFRGKNINSKNERLNLEVSTKTMAF